MVPEGQEMADKSTILQPYNLATLQAIRQRDKRQTGKMAKAKKGK